MKKNTILLILLLCPIFSIAQCPDYDIILSSQAEVDNFSTVYPNCTELTHNVKVEEVNGFITNLNGLSEITSAQQIFIFRTHVEDLYGLHNLETIHHLALWFNVSLQNLEGLDSVVSIEMLEMFINPIVTDLSGMLAIEDINNINFLNNQNLSDLSELSFIEVIHTLILGGNNISDLTGLENIYKVTGDLNINHEQLVSLEGFNNLESIEGSLFINFNDHLQSIDGFNNIERLENLSIIENINLQSLVGFNNLKTVSDKVRIGFNHSLEDLYGLISLEAVNNMEVYENDGLLTLKGLENLHYVYERVLINDNPVLYNVEHLINVSADEVDDVIMINNQNLSKCDFQLFCNVVNDDSVYKVIANNALGCSSIEQVEESCIDGFNNPNQENETRTYIEKITFYPNPVTENLQVVIPETYNYSHSIVYSLYGEALVQSTTNSIDFSNLSNGVYFIEITTDKGLYTQKIIKE